MYKYHIKQRLGQLEQSILAVLRERHRRAERWRRKGLKWASDADPKWVRYGTLKFSCSGASRATGRAFDASFSRALRRLHEAGLVEIHRDERGRIEEVRLCDSS